MTPADEARHSARPEPGWCEWWSFDAASTDGAWGLFVRMALHPGLGRCSYWAGVAREGGPYLLVRDDDLPLPGRSAGLEVRGSLWATCQCDAPLEQWTIGLESHAVVFGPGDAADAWGDERGAVGALGLDLEWADHGGRRSAVEPDGYARWGEVHGEVLVGEGRSLRRVALDGLPGVRRHVWGVPRATSWSWSYGPGGAFTVDERGEALPRTLEGFPRTDGRLVAVAPAPVLATEPAGARVGRALGRSLEGGHVGWMESWYAPAPR